MQQKKTSKETSKTCKKGGATHNTSVPPEKEINYEYRFKVVLLVKPPITYTPLKNSQFP